MTYTGIKTAQGSGVGMIRACSHCGTEIRKIEVRGVTEDPVYCAHCGNKLRQIPSGFPADKLVEILNNVVSPESVVAEAGRKGTKDA